MHLQKHEKLRIALCVVFAVLAVCGNLIYQKFMHVELPLLGVFELSVGAILYAFTYRISDLIV